MKENNFSYDRLVDSIWVDQPVGSRSLHLLERQNVLIGNEFMLCRHWLFYVGQYRLRYVL